MKITNQSQLIHAFFSESVKEKEVGNVRIESYGEVRRLIYYQTILIEKKSGSNTYHLNTTRYSNSTSKLQHTIRAELTNYPNAEVIRYSNVPRGVVVLEGRMPPDERD